MTDPVGTIVADFGEAAVADVVRRFYAKVRHDDVIGPLYPPDDWEQAERRLRLFLVQRFGGPTTYDAERGHPRLRMRHAPFAITPDGARRWLELMAAALEESVAAGACPPELPPRVWDFFVGTATFLVNRPPDTEP